MACVYCARQAQTRSRAHVHMGGKEPVGYHRVSPLKFEHHLIYLVATGKSLEAYSNTTAEAKWRVFVNISPQHFTLFDETVPKEHQDTILRTIRNWCRGN